MRRIQAGNKEPLMLPKKETSVPKKALEFTLTPSIQVHPLQN